MWEILKTRTFEGEAFSFEEDGTGNSAALVFVTVLINEDVVALGFEECADKLLLYVFDGGSDCSL
jgi:hypothetical protein